MSDFDVAVIGAGVVGLACAARLATTGRSVLVVDRHPRIGQETSSRNSGVIHAGIYYPAGSLKAALCVEGRRMLYARCQRNAIPHRKIGKLIVATKDDELPVLMKIREGARENGVDLALLSAAEAKGLEPHVRARAALWSPESGIVDAHELLGDYLREATDHGAIPCLNTAITSLRRDERGWTLATRAQTGELADVTADWVVNAAGLHADRIAALAGLDVDALDWRLRWCKGDYFVLASWWSKVVSHLVYPIPSPAGLGVHLTLDLGGNLIAGPDTEYVDALDHDVRPEKARVFAEAVARYLPGIAPSDLSPGYAGIRPKLQGPGEPVRDFVIDHRPDFAGLVNLVGIESPGLTASEAIADRVARIVEREQ